MIAPDTSVLVAGFDSTHPFFVPAAQALAEVKAAGKLVAHTIAETFSVLSAPAGPYPATATDALSYLDQFLGRVPLGVSPASYPAAVAELASLGVAGGSVYDGLIAIAARDERAELISLDGRAAGTYDKVEVTYRLLSHGALQEQA